MTTSQCGAWCDHLGHLDEYIVLRRRMKAADGLLMGAEMFLDPKLVPRKTIEPRELHSTNLRSLLEARLGLRSVHVSHDVVLETLSAELAARLGFQAEEACLRLEARTTSDQGRPFYFQHIYAPASRVSLTF